LTHRLEGLGIRRRRTAIKREETGPVGNPQIRQYDLNLNLGEDRQGGGQGLNCRSMRSRANSTVRRIGLAPFAMNVDGLQESKRGEN